MTIEEVDELFKPAGFWRQMFPRILGSYVFFVGVGLASISGDWSLENFFATSLVVFFAVVVPQFIRYKISSNKHDKLKKEYGDKYIKLIKCNKISITPETVVILGAPGKQAEQLLQKA